MSLFVDTSAWYAAADSGECHNQQAKTILGSGERLVTSDHILVESWMLLRHRLNRWAAEQFWNALRSGAAAIEVVTAADLESAWAIGERYPDQDFSIVDRTSFVVMQRLGIRRVATFDNDFAIFRYGHDRLQAFEMVR